MPDDLSSIEGLADKHLRALARQHVTDLRGLVQADPRAIHRAMASLRPRPTLELISRWQDDARRLLDQPGTPGWHTAASFVIVFSQRHADGAWDRRVEVERTEVEPERDPQRWPGWDCAPVCAWMTSQLTASAEPVPRLASESQAAGLESQPAGLESQPAGLESQAAAEPEAQPLAGVQPPAVTPLPAGRARLRVDSAAVIDAAGRTDLVKAGELLPDPRTQFARPVRVVFTVSGGRPGSRLQAVTRIQRPDAPGWNPADPVTPSASGQARFDLSAVPDGRYELSLIAWAPDASARPVSLALPPVTIRG